MPAGLMPPGRPVRRAHGRAPGCPEGALETGSQRRGPDDLRDFGFWVLIGKGE